MLYLVQCHDFCLWDEDEMVGIDMIDHDNA
jgi:hypothetical protein